MKRIITIVICCLLLGCGETVPEAETEEVESIKDIIVLTGVEGIDLKQAAENAFDRNVVCIQTVSDEEMIDAFRAGQADLALVGKDAAQQIVAEGSGSILMDFETWALVVSEQFSEEEIEKLNEISEVFAAEVNSEE